MEGILVQTTRGLRALIEVASDGADAEAVQLAFRALRDQWTAAAREASREPADAVARFDAAASAVLGAAYRPVLEVLCSGRAIVGDDLAIAQRCSGWLNRAYESLLEGDHEGVERCMTMAAGSVGLAPHRPGDPA